MFYHIVYKIDQKDKPSLKDVKDDIIDVLATQKKNADTNLYYKSLISMREKAKIFASGLQELQPSKFSMNFPMKL